MAVNPKLVAIVGPTGSGKSDLALQLAQEFGGEIIAADSRTIYRGMDIVTAKPTVADQLLVPHHLLDVVEPGERFTAADFKKLTEGALADISRRGKLPMLVGGSGLYVDSVLYDYQFPGQSDVDRAELERLGIDELQARLGQLERQKLNTIDVQNRRRLVRAIETVGRKPTKMNQILSNTLLLGLKLDKETTQNRLKKRTDQMVAAGLAPEIEKLAQKYGWGNEAMTGIGCRAFKGYIEGRKTLEQAKADFVAGDMKLVKKQLTWFKRNPYIIWLERPADAQKLVADFL